MVFHNSQLPLGQRQIWRPQKKMGSINDSQKRLKNCARIQAARRIHFRLNGQSILDQMNSWKTREKRGVFDVHDEDGRHRITGRINAYAQKYERQLFLYSKTAQHSVHPTGGSLRVFRQFAWLKLGSVKAALSRPAHQRVTPAVGTPLQVLNTGLFAQVSFENSHPCKTFSS